MSDSFFLTGTDTAVGKTRIATALLNAASQQGLSTLGLKPVAAGCELNEGAWTNDDARKLVRASSINPDYSTVNPVALRAAMAPHIAAEQEGVTLHCEEILQQCGPQIDRADFTVIEGAGGWLVPLNEHETMADLAAALCCPVILVVGMRLGCINHALLSAAAIRDSGLLIAGWVANHIDPRMPVADENFSTLQERLDAPLIGRVPWSPESAIESHLNLSALLQ